ncbi:MAG: c-type cytochrome domain-containing protein, partial [Planctomycetota bacterium]
MFICGNQTHHLAAQSEGSISDEVSYSNDIRPIINNFCTTCHAGDAPEGDFVLTSYEDVLKHAKEGNLLKRINDSEDPMPPGGLMPVYLRRMLRAWADQGHIDQGSTKPATQKTRMKQFDPPEIEPIDISVRGFELLELMQGHWVGSMNLMGQNFDWWAFDYRPISKSHIHGIFEGGTIGNLFTSFFVTEWKGKRTIVARNGGVLNGIY